MVSKTKAWIALVHYPVLDKNGNIITTSVTNMDVHDIARSARTFGLSGFYIVTPIKIHREMVSKVVSYWQDPAYWKRTPSRKEALELVKVAASINEVIDLIKKETGVKPRTVGTTARLISNSIAYSEMRKQIMDDFSIPFVFILGTGWGLASSVLENCDYVLKPIEGFNGYAHLSVRSAAAIILDRLFGNI